MRFLFTLLTGMSALILSPASSGKDASTLVLGTATAGGGFALYGEAVAATVHETDPSLKIDLRATKGSGENVPLLEAGRLDLALVEGTIAHEALDGVGRAPANLSVVAAMYSSPGMFVVRADSPYRTIADLRGRRVVFGAASSGLVVLARYVLDGLGLSMRDDFDAVLLESAKDGPPMVLNGEAAALWGGGLGWPGFTAVAGDPGGARFIGPEAGDIGRIQAKHPFLKTMIVPAGSYPGQDRAITTAGSWSLILAKPGLPDDVAYRFARALHRGQSALGQRLAAAQETTALNTIAAAADVRKLHPGVADFFREIGLLP